MKTDEELSSCFDCAAYIPCYREGNSVRAVKKDGQTMIIERSIKSLLKGILKENSIDFNSLRKNYSDSISRKNLIPIPLGLNRVLIPVKVRKAIAVNDGSYGYVDLSSIKNVTEGETTVIHLTCGADISCLETKKTINERMSLGKIVSEKHASRILRMNSLKDGMAEVYGEYDGTATRADIIMLVYEILRLRQEINRSSLENKNGGD